MSAIGLLADAELLDPGFTARLGVSRWIASGDCADVHELDDGRVIRIADVGLDQWPDIKNIHEYLMVRPSRCVVRVDDMRAISACSKYMIYYAVMERLHPIVDENEGETVCAVVNSVWKTREGGHSRIDNRIISKTAVAGLQRALRMLPFTHEDIHWGNIMKSDSGQYKLVDIDSFQHSFIY